MFGQVVRNMRLIAVTLNTQGELTYCNDYFLELTGWTLPEVIGCDWFDKFCSSAVLDLRRVFADLLLNLPSAWHHENAILTRSKETIFVRWNNSVVYDSSGMTIGVASIGEDITERRLLEREVLDASSLERRRIVADLHDGLGQSLYGARLLAHSLEAAARKSGDRMLSDLGQLVRTIEICFESCRRLAHGVSPFTEMRGGLVRALKSLTHRSSSNHRPEIKLTVLKDAPLCLDDAVEDHLYRLAQEAVSNALRHAAASAIHMTLAIQPSRVTLTITDDGVGLPRRMNASTHLGLKLMRYRANIIRGELSISSVEPRGTRIICECVQPYMTQSGRGKEK
jgi:PAS domain S-box-containing protein